MERFETKLHNIKESESKLLSTKLSFCQNKDGNCMQMVNTLIREGWELVYIRDVKNEIINDTIELEFFRSVP